MENIRTIGTIGAGHIGTAVARLAVAAGYEVVLSNSRGPETLTDLVAELGPSASADTTVGAATRGDLVVVTIPLHAIGAVPVEPLAGKVVIDTNNYYAARDGQIAELDDHRATSAGLLQRHLPTSHVVKAFNHIQSTQLESEGTPAGTPGRRALALFGDDGGAVDTVSRLARRARLRRRPGRPARRELADRAGQPRLRAAARRRRAAGGAGRRDPLNGLGFGDGRTGHRPDGRRRPRSRSSVRRGRPSPVSSSRPVRNGRGGLLAIESADVQLGRAASARSSVWAASGSGRAAAWRRCSRWAQRGSNPRPPRCKRELYR